MKEQLITFETAKLAKEKGFKLQSNPFGYVTKYYVKSTGTLRSHGMTGRTKQENLIYAPTQSLLQKWLREEHNIFMQVDVNYCYRIYNNDELHTESNEYNNYEEALEKGLVEALKLIK